jgi:transposase
MGLIERHRSGRPRKLAATQEQEAIEWVKENPRSIKKILGLIADKTGISICKETLRRMCKKAGLRWKRIKKTLKNKRDEESYQECVEMIAELFMKEKQFDLDLFYFDESGFNRQPCVPGAKQETGKNIEVPSSHSKSFNVLGFINHSCQFESFVFEGSVNTDVVIEGEDEFSKSISKPTYVLIDNAPTHTSDLFLGQLNFCAELGLHVKPISAYSPELNIIEILWRKIKYEWMPFSAYESLDTLKKELFNILKNLGEEYVIAYA